MIPPVIKLAESVLRSEGTEEELDDYEIRQAATQMATELLRYRDKFDRIAAKAWALHRYAQVVVDGEDVHVGS